MPLTFHHARTSFLQIPKYGYHYCAFILRTCPGEHGTQPNVSPCRIFFFFFNSTWQCLGQRIIVSTEKSAHSALTTTRLAHGSRGWGGEEYNLYCIRAERNIPYSSYAVPHSRPIRIVRRKNSLRYVTITVLRARIEISFSDLWTRVSFIVCFNVYRLPSARTKYRVLQILHMQRGVYIIRDTQVSRQFWPSDGLCEAPRADILDTK